MVCVHLPKRQPTSLSEMQLSTTISKLSENVIAKSMLGQLASKHKVSKTIPLFKYMQMSF